MGTTPGGIVVMFAMLLWTCLGNSSDSVVSEVFVGGLKVVESEFVVTERSSLLLEEVSETLSLKMSMETAPGSVKVVVIGLRSGAFGGGMSSGE